MAIYLEFEGIKGTASADGFKDQWVIDDLNFSINRHINMSVGDTGNRETGTTTLSEVTFNKALDDSAALLFKEACGGTGKKVKISIAKTSEDKVVTYMVYELEECKISSYHVNLNSADEAPTEHIAISYTKFNLSYTKHDSKGKAGSPERAFYDLKTGKRG